MISSSEPAIPEAIPDGEASLAGKASGDPSPVHSVAGGRLELPEDETVRREVGALLESALYLRRLAEALLGTARRGDGQPGREPAPLPYGLQEVFRETEARLLHAREEGTEERVSRQGWQQGLEALRAFHASLGDWTRQRCAGASRTVASCYLEGQLRTAVATSPPSPGPYLQPLLLESYGHHSDFCRRHGLDPSQLHRVLQVEGSISLRRLLPILSDFAGHGPGRTAYELRVVEAERALQRCRAGFLGTASRSSRDATDRRPGVDLDTFCRRMLAAGSEGRPLDLPPGAYDRSYALRVLHRKTPGSFRFFSLLTFPRHALIPWRLDTAGPLDDREAAIDFASGW